METEPDQEDSSALVPSQFPPLAWTSQNVLLSPSRPWPPLLPPPPLQTHLEVLPESHPPSDQKDVDPLIPSAQTAADEPETNTHGDPIDEDVVDDSMETDEAPPFNMLRFLQDAQADRAAQAAATEQQTAKPGDWAEMSQRQRKCWRKNH